MLIEGRLEFPSIETLPKVAIQSEFSLLKYCIYLVHK